MRMSFSGSQPPHAGGSDMRVCVPAALTLVLLSVSRVTCKAAFLVSASVLSAAVTVRGAADALLVRAVAVADSETEPSSKSACSVRRTTYSNTQTHTQTQLAAVQKEPHLWLSFCRPARAQDRLQIQQNFPKLTHRAFQPVQGLQDSVCLHLTCRTDADGYTTQPPVAGVCHHNSVSAGNIGACKKTQNSKPADLGVVSHK